MLIGKESPQWAKDLVGHWISFTDSHTLLFVIAFVWNTDTFYEKQPPNVRVFIILPEEAWDEVRANGPITGQGIDATYIEEGKYQVVDPPKGLESWTERQSVLT